MAYMEENDEKELLLMIDELIWLLHQQKQNIQEFKSKPLKDMRNPTTLGSIMKKRKLITQGRRK